MFSVNADDLQFLFELTGQSVLINNVKRRVIITNPKMSKKEERYIHTLEGVLQGDIVTIGDEIFLTIGESTIKRQGKFKAKIRHCNYVIEVAGEIRTELKRDENGEIVRDKYGRPIEIQVQGEPIQIPSIVDNDSFKIIGGQILVAENRIIVTVQDNETNRNRFKVNGTFNLMDKNWKVKNQDRTLKGLLVLICEAVIS
ncbi:hypothetical protein V7149_21470 [Bacillus sp. JJ1503]|uniref:hypothetical protein n=1 Tax=Bacillus sp. JJ1503 TaxID=3122956 RepID=UPI002FFF8A05